MFNLDNAVVYDNEVLCNCFTITVEFLNSDTVSVWEISEFRDDRVALFAFLDWCAAGQIPMIGFNNVGYDYVILHYIFNNRNCTPADIYRKNQEIFAAQGDNRFGLIIWDRDRFAPQIDLFLIHHFNNKAKTTSLKALQINMRCETVVDSPVEFGTFLTREQIANDLIPYNFSDTTKTKQFARYSMDAINFRISLIPEYGIEVLNWNDVKIGCKIFERQLGDDILYDRSSGRKVMRQTPRSRIALNDIIFNYISFANPEFQRVHQFMLSQVLTPDDLDDPDAAVKTKGVFKGLVAPVGGIDFYFGTGGVHASVPPQRFTAGNGWRIRDIDVKALYPSIAIVNKLYPAHIGPVFTPVYVNIGKKRGEYKKGTYMNGAYKLANNGPWGQSNNKFSPFYDPQYAMTIPINGQLMICMLAEQLVNVPTLSLIQANTDGITYYIHDTYEPMAAEICKQWEAFTCLQLEDVDYARMWIRDVNNYVAEPVTPQGSNEPPAYKLKGAYWTPDPHDYANSISTASPPCWYKDLGNCVSIRAAVEYMKHGTDPEAYIRFHTDPYDFMLRVKAPRADRLYHGDQRIQNTSRYYVSNRGAALYKISPPKGPAGAFKRANGVTEAEYVRVMSETGGAWDERVCTKNKSRYDEGRTNIEAGYNVSICNNVRDFDFDNINYTWYVNEAKKLIIS